MLNVVYSAEYILDIFNDYQQRYEKRMINIQKEAGSGAEGD